MKEESIEEYIEGIMRTFPEVNQSHRRMMQKVGYYQQKKIDELLTETQKDIDAITKLKNQLAQVKKENELRREALEAKLAKAVECLNNSKNAALPALKKYITSTLEEIGDKI